MGLMYFFENYVPLCDHWMLADNSKIPFTIVAEGDKHTSKIFDMDKYKLIWSMAHPDEREEDI